MRPRLPNPLRWSVAIFASVFAFYLLTSSREPAWGDGHGMWEVAERIVTAGRIDIATHWPEDIPAGQGGLYYGIAPIGPSLAHVPGVLVQQAGHAIAPRADRLVRPLATHVGPAALGALACALFFGLLIDLGIRARTASMTTAVLACATTTWIYARMPYSEILQLACFVGWFRQVLRVADEPDRRGALWLGAWAGLLFNAKYVFGAALVGGALVIAWTLRARRRELVRVLAWAAATGVPLLGVALWYNWARWGSVARTGYEPYLDAYFGGSLFDGAWGMLASPNKSVFLYSPPLVLAAIGFPAAIRHGARFGFAVAAIVVPVFLVYATYRSWSGDYAWGPRFFVWATPIVLVPFAFFLDHTAAAWRTRTRRAVVGIVVAAGVGVQVVGASLYWDHFIRIAIEVKNQWLGNPNRAGSYIPARGRGHCDSCFEDTYELLWTPAFQPIRGHLWLLRALARGDDATSAQADAPWRNYTHLDVNLASTYPRARVDWWGLLWLVDDPSLWLAGLVTMIAFVGVLAVGVWRWFRMHRGAT